MPRLRFIEEHELDAEKRALIASAERTVAHRCGYYMLCAQTVGVGRLVRSLNIVSWEEACELNPALEKA